MNAGRTSIREHMSLPASQWVHAGAAEAVQEDHHTSAEAVLRAKKVDLKPSRRLQKHGLQGYLAHMKAPCP